ncbi:sensor histidine kinase [Cohnella luojiensis]|uniref:Sensor histidine kinase n=1 Tax=Cohnella luojiensis TaxID=652876 RepID=A0A4Y8M4C0_9BACL|nr:sensor histidine kinase [Cohnella luojiensis]TFE27165.1 sensor histidine kinase [Cohnella luojiensis]
MKLKERFGQLSLRQKLILAFASFIVIPFFIIGGTLSWLYIDSNRSMILEAAVQNNKQIIDNIDTSLNPILNLSMYPVQDKIMFQMMKKDYPSVPYPLYEREKDFDTAGGIIKNNMLYSNLVDSAVIYQSKNRMVIGRSSYDYMDHHYLNNEFYNETFVQTILNKKGEYAVIGVHPEKLMSFHDTPVVSIGRAIVDPYSKQNLGFILLNIGVDKLKTLWSDIHFTEHTSFYLVDENDRVIYSESKSEIGQPAVNIIGQDFEQMSGEEQGLLQNRDVYLISSVSHLSNWRGITIIPKNELFEFVNTIVRTIAISLLILLVLSIATSVYIATGITRPLLILQKKMKLVAQGNLDVSIDIQKGEIGKISITIDDMLKEIRSLIGTIYEDEQEKRQLEVLALQSQIKPHFMYNTLNSIKWMAKLQGASGIEEALTAFSSVIRFTAKTESDFVAISEEAAFIRDYTKILEFRYFNKFEVTFNIQPEVMEYRTLKFLLQPLIENAIFHGFDEIPYKGELKISIFEQSGRLIMVVADNGRGFNLQERDKQQDKDGDQLNEIGVNNIRKRIELHFGEEYGLWITSEVGRGTIAKIVVPVIRTINKGEEL